MSDCEIPEFYGEGFPVARKPHRCCECLAPIEPGEKHLRWAAKWDGDLYYGRQHMLCRELCMFMNQEGDGCCPFGGMKDTFREEDWHLDKYDDLHRKARTLMAGILKRERRARYGARAA